MGLISALTYLFFVDRQNRAQFERIYTETIFETADNINAVETNLSKMLVSVDSKLSADLANEVWRQASLGSANLARLPDSEGLADTHGFFVKVGDYAKYYAMRLYNGHKPSAEDYDRLNDFHMTCKTVSDEVLGLVREILAGEKIFGRRWPGYKIRQNPLSARIGNGDAGRINFPNVVYDGEYSDGIQAPTNSPHNFVAEYRQIGAAVLTEEDARAEAVKAAEAYEYRDMTPVRYSVSGGRATVELAKFHNEIIYYTDVVKVQVALDNGEVVAFAEQIAVGNGSVNTKPTISEKTAISLISKKAAVTSAKLAVVMYDGNPRLTYELTAEYGGMLYRIYLDAHDGRELIILRQ